MLRFYFTSICIIAFLSTFVCLSFFIIIMTKSSKRLTFSLLFFLIAGIIAFPYIKRHYKAKHAEKKIETAAQTAPMSGKKALHINAEVIQYQTITDQTITTGNIIPFEEVNLSFEASGKVVAIYFQEGEMVRKGTLLAKINDKPLQAQLKKLEAQVPLAKDRMYRQEALLQKNAVSQEAYESVVTEYDKLMADIELVKANISQTELIAPFDGMIGLRQVSEGAYATPSTSVAKLSQVSQLKIEFSIPESYASEVKKGTKIVFRMEDSDGNLRQYNAAVYAVESAIDLDTRTLKVRAIYNNPRLELVPGRFVSVEIKRREIENAISVPSEAIIPEMGRSLVYLYKSGKAQPAEITTGIRTEARVQVLSGIHAGDTVMTTGVMQLRMGMPVIIDQLK